MSKVLKDFFECGSSGGRCGCDDQCIVCVLEDGRGQVGKDGVMEIGIGAL